MDTTYTLDESGIITQVFHKGKPVKAGYMRGLKKAQATAYWSLSTNGCIVRNPFSGVEKNLDAFELSLYCWLMRWYARYEDGGPTRAGAPIQAYDDVKYLLLEINADAYYDLID
jgi:hypothetical protein